MTADQLDAIHSLAFDLLEFVIGFIVFYFLYRFVPRVLKSLAPYWERAIDYLADRFRKAL